MRKKKELAAILLSAAMILGTVNGCGNGAENEAVNAVATEGPETEKENSDKTIGDGTESTDDKADSTKVPERDEAGDKTDASAGTEKETSGEKVDTSEGAGSETSDDKGDPFKTTDDGSKENNTEPAKVHDVFDELSADEIVAQMGAGWNLGNQLEAASGGSSYETAWGNPIITPELLKFVKEQGFSTVRIPVSYLGHIGSKENGYEIDEKWMIRVNQVVDYAMDAGLYAIINVHGDGYETIQGGWLLPNKKNQEEILEKYEAVWRQIAERYKDYDEHLIFESMNEVGSESACNAEIYKNINAYNQTFLDTVRQTGGNNDKRWVLIPGYNTNIDKTTDNSGFAIPVENYLSKEVPENEHRIMISVHYYDPWSFCGGESDEATQWGVNADGTKTANWGDEAFMEQQFKKMYDKFSSQGYPVVIGEYGSIDKSHADAQSVQFRAYFAAKVCEKAIRYGLVPVYWDNGYNGKYGFGLFQRRKIEMTQPEIVAAIVGAFEEGESEGSATGIALSETALTLVEAAGSAQLAAKLTPEDCADKVVWSSSDESVATVSDDGKVRPNGEGVAVITAKCGSVLAQCEVTVEKATETMINLYILETKGWQTASGEEGIVIAGDGSYKASMKVSKAVLENIGSFYFKDMQVQSGTLGKSLMKSCKITIDAVSVNGQALTLTGKASGVEAVNNGSFDYCLLNRWATGNEAFEEFTMNANADYNFSGVEILDTNEIVVEFTISNVNY